MDVVCARENDPSAGVLTDEDVQRFRRDGHLYLRAVYDAERIRDLAGALADTYRAAGRDADVSDRLLMRTAFLSRRSHEARAYALDPRLGAFAARLLGVRGIRLIHDVTILKGPEHKSTPWHRDSEFWSFHGIGALTMWIPLQETPLSMSPLRYASGSHLDHDQRSLNEIEKALIHLRYRVVSSPLMAGDVAVHHFRTLHGSARNVDHRPRRAFAVHLIDADARFRVSSVDGHATHARQCGWDRLQDGDPFPDDVAPLVYRAPHA